MTSTLESLLSKVGAEGLALTREEARAVLRQILDAGNDSVTDAQIAELLTAMSARGETAAELTGFVEAMREAATPLPLLEEERVQLVDTCGTGGDGLGTFNISTGAALVAAAAGAHVAKHGNRAVTSKTGSADVLEALGVPVNLQPTAAVECLRTTGFIFLLATALHPAMRRVAPVRRALGFRTIFNLAGPLSNPAGAQAQVMGVWDQSRIVVVAEAMELLGVRHALVVHGEAGAGSLPGAGLDELTVTGTSHIAEVRPAVPGVLTVQYKTLQPEDLGLSRAPLSLLGGGGSAQESASVLLRIFEGQEHGARRDIVILNAAAALLVSGIATDLLEGMARAAQAIDDGAATNILMKLRTFANRHPG